MQDFTSKDGQYGYIKDQVANVWRKVRLADQTVVSSVVVPPLRGGFSERKPPKYSKTYEKQKETVAGNYYKDFKPLAPLPAAQVAKDHYYFNGCGHDGTKMVWASQGKELYAAGAGRIKPEGFNLVLDLADQVDSPRWRHPGDNVIMSGSPSAFFPLNRLVLGLDGKPRKAVKELELPHNNVVHFHWPDGGVLPVDTEFWEALWKGLPTGKTLVCCFGSHGRTGTCLAALMLAADDKRIWSPKIAALTVRSRHCEMAIENRHQLKYLNKLAEEWGMPLDALEADAVLMGKSGEELARLEKEAANG